MGEAETRGSAGCSAAACRDLDRAAEHVPVLAEHAGEHAAALDDQYHRHTIANEIQPHLAAADDSLEPESRDECAARTEGHLQRAARPLAQRRLVSTDELYYGRSHCIYLSDHGDLAEDAQPVRWAERQHRLFGAAGVREIAVVTAGALGSAIFGLQRVWAKHGIQDGVLNVQERSLVSRVTAALTRRGGGDDIFFEKSILDILGSRIFWALTI